MCKKWLELGAQDQDDNRPCPTDITKQILGSKQTSSIQ